MHRKSERNERRAHLSTLIINVATGSSAPIHPFPWNFQPHTGLRRNSPDICLPTISIFLFLPPLRYTRNTVGFPNSIFSLDHFSPSFTRIATVPEQFRLFEQRREYYSADYARLFRLENPFCDFRRAGGSSYRQYVFCKDIDIYIYNDERFQTFQGEVFSSSSLRRFHSTALQLFPTNYMIKIFFCRNSAERTWQREESRFHRNAQNADQ